MHIPKPILVIGNSHAAAVDRAVIEQAEPNVEVWSLNNGPSLPDNLGALQVKRGDFVPEMAAGLKPDVVFSMIGGNFHLMIGIMENPIRFDFMDETSTIDEVDDTRTFIPYAAMEAHFYRQLKKGQFRRILELRDAFGVNFAHISGPPAFASSEHIAKYPGSVFKDMLHLGVTPPRIRQKLFKLQTKVLKQLCAEHDIPFIDPPIETIDENGLLMEPYWVNDPSHANTAYGKLVLAQILEFTGGLHVPPIQK